MVARGSKKKFSFDECMNVICSKLHEQYIPGVSDYLRNSGKENTVEAVFTSLNEKVWEFHPRIKRIRNCMEIKRKSDEPIMDNDILVKPTREAALYDDLKSEQARTLYVILTANNQSLQTSA